MQQISKYYDNLCELIEKENKITEIGLYGLSFGLLSYAFIRHRPISRFTAARDIPDHFIRDRILLEGTVVKAEPTARGAVLSVEHKSPVNISFTNKTLLPVIVGGVQIDPNGLAWLQNITQNRKIKFVPLSNEGNECIARVFIVRDNLRTLDAAQSLVQLGFAKATPFPDQLISRDRTLIGYQNKLKTSEKIAKAMRKGQWHLIPENWLKWKLRRTFEMLQFNLKPASMKLPIFVR